MIAMPFGETVLQSDEIDIIAEALKTGVINMVDFKPFCHKRSLVRELDVSILTDEQAEQLPAIRAKMRFTKDGALTLSRQLKIKLVNVLRSGRINFHADFPDLVEAYQAIRIDWSMVSNDELKILARVSRAANHNQ